jgi:protein-L-isoaspartate(D-aspartate) O-methyltransferase
MPHFLISLLILWALALPGCQESEERTIRRSGRSEEAYAHARERMVQTQIVRRGVRDALTVAAMKAVPRHRFVPESLRKRAYADRPLPIGLDQTISQPYIVAYMTEALALEGGEKVLEIGTGSGYQAAVLAEIADSVFSIEILKPLADRASDQLSTLGYKNVYVRCGDGYQGWPEHAPFDAIIVTAAPDHIPQPLKEQLKIGGRLIIPVGARYQELLLITKTEKGIEEKRLLPVRFVPMTGEAQEKR